MAVSAEVEPQALQHLSFRALFSYHSVHFLTYFNQVSNLYPSIEENDQARAEVGHRRIVLEAFGFCRKVAYRHNKEASRFESLDC